MLLSSVLDTFTLKTGTKYGKINKSFNISAMWSVSQSGSWVCEWAADFLGRRKKECLSPGEQGAQLASFLLFVLIELHSTQLIPQQQPSSPTPPLCSHHQHLIRQLTPPSAGGVGSQPARCWEENLFYSDGWMCFFFFFLFVFLHGLERDFDHLANGTSFLSPLHWGNLCFANFFSFYLQISFSLHRWKALFKEHWKVWGSICVPCNEKQLSDV